MICPCCNQPADTGKLSEAVRVFTPTEARLLRILEGRTMVRKEAVLDTLWADDPEGGPLTAQKMVDVVIHKIRRKLREHNLPFRLETVWAHGYRLARVG